MEFGAPSLVENCTNVVGLSWTTPQSGADAWLITTSASEVAVHAASDGSRVKSWLTRPGPYNAWSVGAVQSPHTRKLFCVQNGNRLYAWNEGDVSLEKSVKVRLRGEVHSLHVALRLPLLLVAYTDGGVSALNESLEEVLWVPPPGDGSCVTWSRFARSASHEATFMLITLHQKVGDGVVPYIKTYTVAPQEGGTPDSPQYVFKHAATTRLPHPGTDGAPPAAPTGTPAPVVGATPKGKRKRGGKEEEAYAAPRPPHVASCVLHKLLHALSLVWSDGTLVVLQFRHTAAWWTTTPSLTVRRQLARFLPVEAGGGDAQPPVDRAPLHCASFALEPSCMVLAGSDALPGSPSAPHTLGLSVWDVRYGVVLASRAIEVGAGEEPEPVVVNDRLRSGSVGSVSGGGFAPTTAPLPGPFAALPPHAVFQVTVSEDNAYVALASRRRVILTGVAVRGASLVSAVGRIAVTRGLLVAEGGRAASTESLGVPWPRS